MDILFQNGKLARVFNSESQLRQKYGERAKFLTRRLYQMGAAGNLEELRSLPQTRCHELKGNREGMLAVDAGHPYRLIFEPANDPIPRKLDGGLDWTNVTAIKILGVEDYHD
ncbi:MAG: type II toxin-antitoxin system RelE/ParE family toxin [Ktedonobacteraceae bacterium]|nr:type II toxin-antitoxin system RelE/ParE family toxin [Ktedonobacteraceae bacterium]